MAINVAYKVPAALLQAERDRERRAFNRQLQLQQNQQNFQREMQDAAYARQLENRQFNADRQDALQKAAWERQDVQQQTQRDWQAQQQQLQRDWQSAQQQAKLDAQNEHYQQEIDFRNWQASMVQKQMREKNYAYSDEAQAELQAIQRDKKQLIADRNSLTPEQYNQAFQQLRMREAAIMPDVPIVKLTPQQEFNERIVTDEKTGMQFLKNDKGGYDPIFREQDTVNRKRLADEMQSYSVVQKNVTDIAKELLKNGTLKSLEEFKNFVSEETERQWNQTPFGRAKAAELAQEAEEERERNAAEVKEKRARAQQEGVARHNRANLESNRRGEVIGHANRNAESEKMRQELIDGAGHTQDRLGPDPEEQRLIEMFGYETPVKDSRQNVNSSGKVSGRSAPKAVKNTMNAIEG